MAGINTSSDRRFTIHGQACFVALMLLLSTMASGAGSKGHDFSKLYGSKEMQCYPCHADDPSTEGTSAQASSTPMWNHSEKQTAYISHQSSSSQGVDDVSRLCLSCHDGVSAKAAMTTSSFSRPHSVGTDLRKGHPIGVDYSRAINGARTKYHRQPGGNIVLTGARKNTVSCVSCHNPHGSTNPKMLRESMYKSKLCFQCHDM